MMNEVVSVSETEALNLLRDCRDQTVERVLASISLMFAKLDDVLFELADKSLDLNDYNFYLAARQKVKERRRAIESEFRSRFVKTFNEAIKREEITQTGFELADGSCISLVENDDLAEAVAAGDIARRIKNRCPEQLFALTRRIGALMFEPDLEDAANPLNPAMICNAFQAACGESHADIRIKLTLLEQFEKFISHDIESIYNDLNQKLIGRNILPKIRISMPRNPARSIPPGSLAAASQREQDVFATLMQLIAPGAPGGFVPMISPKPRTQTVSALTEMQRGNFGHAGGLDFSVPGATNIVREIRQSGFGGALTQMDVMTLDIVAMLFDYILGDKNIPAAMKALIGRLQIPVLKVAMLDKKFFARKSHPARQLLDTLAHAAVGYDDENGRLYAKAESLVQAILDEFEEDTAIFARVVSELEAFLEEEERQAKERAHDAIAQLQDRERAEIAQIVVGDEIAKRAKGIPEAVKAFLQVQWKTALTIAYQSGEDSAPWQDGLAAMDDLVWSVGVKETAEDRKRLVELLPQLLRRLRQGMEQAATPAVEREQFFAELVDLHAAAVRSGIESPVNDSFPQSAAETMAPAPIAVDTFDEDGVVAELQRGSWVEFDYDEGNRGSARLTWVSPSRRIYLFTNRQGLQPLPIPSRELAAKFRNGSARLMQHTPLTERAVASMLAGLQAADSASVT